MPQTHPVRPPAASDPRWAALALVQSACAALGLKDRDIAVLRGLLTLIPADHWSRGRPMVYASNAVLQTRCDGINDRTLRRRLARLCHAGLLTRHTSPNRKRYVVRDEDGAIILTYGFDLSPLRARVAELASLAAEIARTDKAIRARKATLRDRLWQLAQAGVKQPEAVTRLLRRKCTLADLDQAIALADSQLPVDQPIAVTSVPPEMSVTDGQIVRHIHTSDKDHIERTAPATNDLTLDACLTAASSSLEYASERPTTWADLARLAAQLAPAIGIDSKQMQQAQAILGSVGACLAVLGLVQAYNRIKAPARYLSTLLTRARTTGLDIGRMFRSLTGLGRFPAGNHGPCPA